MSLIFIPVFILIWVRTTSYLPQMLGEFNNWATVSVSLIGKYSRNRFLCSNVISQSGSVRRLKLDDDMTLIIQSNYPGT